MQRKALIYSRISRVGGRRGEGFISRETQVVGCEGRAGSLDWGIVGHEHDENETGGNLQRPGWQAIMARLLDPLDVANAVIVVRVDRFARTVAEGAPEVKRIQAAGAAFAAVDVPMDTDTPTGRMLLNNHLTAAEYQLDVLKLSWWDAKEKAIARGAHIGRTPHGLGRVPKNARERAGCLFPLPEWQPILVALFDRLAQSPIGDGDAAAWANTHAPRPDGSAWVARTIASVRTNRVYIGEVSYSPRTQTFAPLVNREAHEPIVSEATFRTAQVRPRNANGGGRLTGVTQTSALLRGKVRCGCCGHFAPPSGGGGTGGAARVLTYHCNPRKVMFKCQDPPTVSRDRLDAFVMDAVRAQFSAEPLSVDIALMEALDRESAAAQHELADAREEAKLLKANTSQMARFPDEWAAAYDAACARERLAETAMQAHVAKRPKRPLGGRELRFEDFTVEDWRDLIGETVDYVAVRSGRAPIGERALVVFAGEGYADLPGKGRPATEPYGLWDKHRAMVGVAPSNDPA